jgi:hypothetical protein
MLLDAHPEIGCPSESGMATLAADLERAWGAICSDIAREPVTSLPVPVLRKLRASARGPMDHYRAQTGKRLYCDKSLDTPDHLDVLGRVFPGARYILLARHVFDVVSSALEVSPYGFSAFGYAPYVQRSVENFVAPLVEHWIARLRPGVAWATTHPGTCHVIRYEDLVTDPRRILSELFVFLGVAVDVSIVDTALRSATYPQARGDAKIGFTLAVHSKSVGRGKRVPLELVPPLLMAEANELLALLGYARVSKDWNFLPDTTRHQDEAQVQDLNRIMPTQIDIRGLAATSEKVTLVVEDVAGLSWAVDMKGGHVLPVTEAATGKTLHASAEVFADLLRQRSNPATLFAEGRLRLSGQEGRRQTVSSDIVELLRALQAATASVELCDKAVPPTG